VELLFDEMSTPSKELVARMARRDRKPMTVKSLEPANVLFDWANPGFSDAHTTYDLSDYRAIIFE
jgi:hypothetical protein